MRIKKEKVRCKAITASGEQCSFNAVIGKYCLHHFKQREMVENESTKHFKKKEQYTPAY